MGSPLAAMSDLMTPLMNVEELDKRITDMRAVEQWLKLNLNMLQSAIQALEVQRATLSTLRAFGAFAQASMSQPASSSTESASPSPWSSGAASATGSAAADADQAQTGGAAEAGAAAQAAQFDPSAWWNLLQSQFNQLASFAMTQPGTAEAASAAGKPGARNAGSRERSATGAGETAGAAGPKGAAAKPAAKRAAPRKSAGKPRGPAASSSQSK
ncbi:transcriptional regulator [Trinickia fusca]|uniref:Transcriptional regulator n=2 Tax=Trinickia fusca TaxID=2419777 RepID=A0A494XFI8_9BURK|nr:transcriptional regulator [Trinickia fusca]